MAQTSPLLHKQKTNVYKKNPSEHPPVMGEKMSKHLGGIKGCKYKTSSWHLNSCQHMSWHDTCITHQWHDTSHTSHTHLLPEDEELFRVVFLLSLVLHHRGHVVLLELLDEDIPVERI